MSLSTPPDALLFLPAGPRWLSESPSSPRPSVFPFPARLGTLSSFSPSGTCRFLEVCCELLLTTLDDPSIRLSSFAPEMLRLSLRAGKPAFMFSPLLLGPRFYSWSSGTRIPSSKTVRRLLLSYLLLLYLSIPDSQVGLFLARIALQSLHFLASLHKTRTLSFSSAPDLCTLSSLTRISCAFQKLMNKSRI